jgi:hypothetical protein
VHIRAWKVRNQLLDDYFTRQMVANVLDPDALRTLETALNDRPWSLRLQVVGSDLCNYMEKCQFERQCIEDQRVSALLAVDSQRKRALEETNMAISYRSHRPTAQAELNVTAIGFEKGVGTAMVNDQLVRAGDTVGQARVIRIGRYEIEFDKGGQKSVVKLMEL